MQGRPRGTSPKNQEVASALSLQQICALPSSEVASGKDALDVAIVHLISYLVAMECMVAARAEHRRISRCEAIAVHKRRGWKLAAHVAQHDTIGREMHSTREGAEGDNVPVDGLDFAPFVAAFNITVAVGVVGSCFSTVAVRLHSPRRPLEARNG